MDNYQITPEDVKQLSKYVTLDMFLAADNIFKTAYNSLANEDIKHGKVPNRDYYYKAASAAVLYAGYVDTAKSIKAHCKGDGWAIYPVTDNLGRESKAQG